MQRYQPAKLVRLHLGERDRYQGQPLYEAILDACRQRDIAGATVFRGLEGFGESAAIHRPRLLGHDLPIVIQIVDSPANIASLLPVLEEMLDKGMIAVSDVTALRIQKNA